MPAWKSSSLVLRKQSRAIAFARRFLTTSLFCISSSDLLFVVYLSAVGKREVGCKKRDATSSVLTSRREAQFSVGTAGS